jgi:hypothetical protein
VSDVAYQVRKRERIPFPPMSVTLTGESGSAGTIQEISGNAPSSNYIDLIMRDRWSAVPAGGTVAAMERGSLALSGGNTIWVSAHSLMLGANTVETLVYNGMASGVTAGGAYGASTLVAASISDLAALTHNVGEVMNASDLIFATNTCPWQVVGVLGTSSPVSSTPDQFARFGTDFGHPNWDGYGAEAIEAATIEAARSFVAMLPPTLGTPDVAPGADGTIGLEWAFLDRPVRKLFIDIGPGNIWSGYWRRASGEKRSLPRRLIDEGTRSYLVNLFDSLSR